MLPPGINICDQQIVVKLSQLARLSLSCAGALEEVKRVCFVYIVRAVQSLIAMVSHLTAISSKLAWQDMRFKFN
jgi:hypothetical protein